jgi:hypothetical protein
MKNNLNNIKDNNELNWEYTTKNKDGIQCRVDDKNQVNIVKQKTFMFEGEESMMKL